jgi:hypothetical protein
MHVTRVLVATDGPKTTGGGGFSWWLDCILSGYFLFQMYRIRLMKRQIFYLVMTHEPKKKGGRRRIKNPKPLIDEGFWRLRGEDWSPQKSRNERKAKSTWSQTFNAFRPLD